MMNKEYVNTLNNYSIQLLRKNNKKAPLNILSRHNCSEVSRIIGLKVLADLGKKSKPFILKGNVTITGLKNNNSHDILGFLDIKSNNYIIIDPTIWQFFPKKKGILLGEFKTKKELMNFISTYYGGVWQVSEYITDSMKNNVSKWEKIIHENCEGYHEK